MKNRVFVLLLIIVLLSGCAYSARWNTIEDYRTISKLAVMEGKDCDQIVPVLFEKLKEEGLIHGKDWFTVRCVIHDRNHVDIELWGQWLVTPYYRKKAKDVWKSGN